MSDSLATRDVSWGRFSRRSAWPAVVLTWAALLGGTSALAQDILPGRRVASALHHGGTTESEAAVAGALKWLAAHQMPDGGWSFNHQQHPQCGGKCRNPGSLTGEARIAATALALLPFLDAGLTHKEGQYKDTVKKGLKFLIARMKQTEHGGSLHEKGGSMYSHGLASIALCEAYAMTRDKGLQEAAQMALNYIAYAQDPVGGGWRYSPRQAGDTSVTGWQILALKTGHMAYLRIAPEGVKKIPKFLDSVQADGGANYGYTQPGSGQATTAIGLLCRMYLGWKRDDPRLVRGVEWLGEQGPSKTNMYYNYFATNAVYFLRKEGEDAIWNKWNNVLRDQLVESQVKDGHEAGSWFQKGDHGADRGGRLYVTAMSAMILEIYYADPYIHVREPEEDFPE
ncbi:MAG: terpene cyclase/mutase family protein [Planctomycetes bacterium]|nr:terpene cyclase/mutase family protein [Planctomycetota bacterium]